MAYNSGFSASNQNVVFTQPGINVPPPPPGMRKSFNNLI